MVSDHIQDTTLAGTPSISNNEPSPSPGAKKIKGEMTGPTTSKARKNKNTRKRKTTSLSRLVAISFHNYGAV